MINQHIELPFFASLFILLVTARILGEIFERFKQPSMIGEIIAGIILGPGLLNIVHKTEDIKVVSELGVFLLVIMAGLGINIEGIIKSLSGRNSIISILAFFLPFISGFGIGYYFGVGSLPSIFIGLCFAITALPVSIRILMDLGKLNTNVGQSIISVAVFDDVLALAILGVLLNIKGTDMSVATVSSVAAVSLLKLFVFIALLSLTYFRIKKLVQKGNDTEAFLNNLIKSLKGRAPLYAMFFAFILLFSAITESLGFHFIVGAFFASMLIDRSLIGKDNLQAIQLTTSNMAMGFLAPIFFAGIGLEFSFTTITNIALLLVVIFLAFLSKIAGGFIGGISAGLNKQTSLTIGIGLNARGIMGLVITNVAYKNGLISSEVFSILVIMSVLTTLATPILLKRAFSRMEIK